MTLPSGTVIGKYVINRQIAEGGMAEIYLGSIKGPEGFEKEVVIKRIKPFLAAEEDFVKMFVSEARVASSLAHANIVQIFEFGHDDQSLYLAMEYVHGHSLWEIRKRSAEMMNRMRPELAAHVCSEVARALNFAHRFAIDGLPAGLVHRDVSPHNILVSYDGAVKLTDFGIAKVQNNHTVPGQLKGKFAYMSPEQSRGQNVDSRTDIFALGIVFWELLTGARLFEGENDLAVVRAVQHSLIVPPARLNPDVPAEINDIVMRALQRNPENRFQTALEMERALSQFKRTLSESIDETVLSEYMGNLYQRPVPQQLVFDSKPVSLTAATHHRARPPELIVKAKKSNGLSREDLSAATYVIEKKEAGAPPVQQSPEAPPKLSSPYVTVPINFEVVPKPKGKNSTWHKVLAVSVGVVVFAMLMALVFNRKKHSIPDSEAAASKVVVAPPQEEHTVLMEEPVQAAVPPPSNTEETPDAAIDQEPVVEKRPTLEPLPEVMIETEPVVEKPPNVPATARPAAATAKSKSSSSHRAKGVLVVRAVPWAQLFIDGKLYGEVVESRQSIKLPSGTHRLKFQHEIKTQRMSVQILAGKETLIEFNARE